MHVHLTSPQHSAPAQRPVCLPVVPFFGILNLKSNWILSFRKKQQHENHLIERNVKFEIEIYLK